MLDRALSKTPEARRILTSVHSGSGLEKVSSNGPCRGIVVSLFCAWIHHSTDIIFPGSVAPQSIESGLTSYRYGDSVRFLATESRETSPEDVALFSKACPGVVCDVRSFFG